LAQLVKGSTAAPAQPPAQSSAPKNSAAPPSLSTENIYVLEKADVLGAHSLSGAVLDPRALRELYPDFESNGVSGKHSVTPEYGHGWRQSMSGDTMLLLQSVYFFKKKMGALL
jgi:hypothetical protein